MKNPLNVFKGIVNEMRKVVWPTPSEMLGMLVFVVLVSSVAAILMLGLDVFFAEVRSILVSL